MTAVHIRDLAYDTDLLAISRAEPQLFPVLLQSMATGSVHGRYDILFVSPPDEWLVFNGSARVSGPGLTTAGHDFLSALDAGWRESHHVDKIPDAGDWPFRGGWFLYLGYEIAGTIEPRVRCRISTDIPQAVAGRARAALMRDHSRKRAVLLWEDDIPPALLADIEAVLPSSGLRVPFPDEPVLATALQEDEPAIYLQQVERAKRYIREGHIFQANLSRAWRAELQATATDHGLYARLREANPAPFAGLAQFGECAVVSSSPERLVRVRSGRVDTRPIAGTRPRSADPERDSALIRELIGHPKERAEHIMLLDLERNDLGRISRTGSVQVDELMVVESYAHVHHIVSNVRGELREGITPAQVIRAVFPGGTITGCPKVRCMEIISELEQSAREAYTGSLGYLNRDGDMDLNILIRTVVRKGRTVEFRAGAGIVADSEPIQELNETRSKARGLARALGADA